MERNFSAALIPFRPARFMQRKTPRWNKLRSFGNIFSRAPAASRGLTSLTAKRSRASGCRWTTNTAPSVGDAVDELPVDEVPDAWLWPPTNSVIAELDFYVEKRTVSKCSIIIISILFFGPPAEISGHHILKIKILTVATVFLLRE